MTNIDELKTQWLRLVESVLDEVLPKAGTRPAALSEAMRYAVGSGGKRIRPLICLASATAVGGKAEDARYPAAAIEILHNYTLVHDDLPAMDNDVERRGRPTVWKAFGEANAILAGDALQALAFQTAAKAPRNVAKIVDVLGEMGVGVVRGQVEDVALSSSSSLPSPRPSAFIYEHKTADLFVAAAKTGALAGGGSDDSMRKIGDFAINLGLAFQYEDDLLDGDGICSREETARRVDETTTAAIEALAGLPGDVAFLAELARSLVGRAS